MRTYRPDYLLALANFLENNVPKNTFNLEAWVRNDGWNEEEGTFDRDREAANATILEKNPGAHASCGTTACAFGWAPSVPELANAGLKLVRYGNSFVPRYEGKESFDAAQLLFGIPVRVAEHFFDPEHYAEDDLTDPKEVVRRIREFISNPVEYYQDNLE